jgi:integrase
MTRVIDIHQYDKRYHSVTAHLLASDISARNKELVLGYRDACLVRQLCGKVRLIRVIGCLEQLARRLGKDFDHVTTADVHGLIATLLARKPAYSKASIATYKAILKRFLTWVSNPDEFGHHTPAPANVAWLTVHLRRRDEHRLQRHDLLLPTDVTAAVATTHNPRDRALLEMLWETGGRVGEIGNLQRKHITPTQHGYHLDLTGKTGQRSVLIVSSAPALTEWLNHHPDANPEAPVWHHYQYRAALDFVGYRTISQLIKNAFCRAQVKKRIYPHIFRHSRATFVLATGLMNESQAKAYFGWTPGSNVLSHYAHLLASDANNAILRENHLAPATPTQDTNRPRSCPHCQAMNPKASPRCIRCNALLDEQRAILLAQEETTRDDLLRELCTLIVERGLADDVARLVHRAGLGRGLQTLAEKDASRTNAAAYRS